MPRRPPEPHVGHRVRQLRLGSGMTQEQLAERSHVAPETISRIERGKLVPAVDVLVGIASVLEVTLDELVLTTKPLKKRTTGLRPAVQRIGGTGERAFLSTAVESSRTRGVSVG